MLSVGLSLSCFCLRTYLYGRHIFNSWLPVLVYCFVCNTFNRSRCNKHPDCWIKKIHVTICWSFTLGIHLFIKQGICFLLWDKMKLDKDSYTSHQLETLKKWLVAPKGEVGRVSWNFNRILFTGITFIVCNSFHPPSLVEIEPRILSIISSALFSLFWLKGINIPFFPKMYS